jgi:Glyoxalase superfamily protein/Clp amino terminal domain, pathogenicity island component
MRDFRDAKAMAHTLRAALAAQGLKITISQSLELIAQAFGVADWNTLAAAIRRETPAPSKDAPSPPLPTPDEAPVFSRDLELTLHRALTYANERKHEYATLEHLLLALIDDVDAAAVMEVCQVDLGALRTTLASYVDNELKTLVTGDDRDATPTAAFQRVVQRAVLHVQDLGRDITGADLLVAIFAETESPAVWLLGQQGMTRYDAVNFILHGIVKASGRGKRSVEQGGVRQTFSHGRTKPLVVEKVKTTPSGTQRPHARAIQ